MAKKSTTTGQMNSTKMERPMRDCKGIWRYQRRGCILALQQRLTGKPKKGNEFVTKNVDNQSSTYTEGVATDCERRHWVDQRGKDESKR